ncbi:MAG: NAD(P)/FAD-dependent oxidoreductase [Dehalococcoidia bacterium]
MKCAIAGAGVAGAVLSHVLRQKGVKFSIYGKATQTACGIRSCGWGVQESMLRLLKSIGIDPTPFILSHHATIRLGRITLPTSTYSIDKPELIQQLLGSEKVDTAPPPLSDFDVVVDATGVRAYSPPANDEKIANTFQVHVKLPGKTQLKFDFIQGGYLWTIPLADGEAHIGGGSSSLASAEIERLVWKRVEEYKASEMCSCSDSIRFPEPSSSIVNGNVVAVGESAGLVIPYLGAGIYSAAESALITAQHIGAGNIQACEKAIRKRFGWLRGVREAVDMLENGKLPLSSLISIHRALKYQDAKPKLTDLVRLRETLLAANRGVDSGPRLNVSDDNFQSFEHIRRG